MSVFATLVHHPRRLWLRRALFGIHLWMGVLFSVYILVIALSGSLLVFRSELTQVLVPKALRYGGGPSTLAVSQVIETLHSAYPGWTFISLQAPLPQLPAYVLSAKDAAQQPFTVLADPVTGRLWRQPRTWLDWVYDLHVYLLLGHAHGMQINGIGAASLLLITVTGISLWWPGLKLWTRGLRIHFRHSWRRINYDAHSAIGFWTLLIVFWWALSGVYFAWYRPFTAAVAAVSPLRAMLSPALPVIKQASPGRASLQQVLDAAHQASPRGTLFSVSDPLLTGNVVYVLMDQREPGDFSHRDILAISTADAKVLTLWHYGENHSAGDWLLWSMHPLHFGTLWGLPVKILWASCGVALAVLTCTGLLMYWNRFLRHQFPA